MTPTKAAEVDALRAALELRSDGLRDAKVSTIQTIIDTMPDEELGISPSGGRVVMTLAGTAVPTRGARRR